MNKNRQKIDLVTYQNITMGVGLDWTGASYDVANYVYDLPLDMVVKSATVIVEHEQAPDIPYAYTITIKQGDNVSLDEGNDIFDLNVSGDNSLDVKVSWLPDNVISFVHPYHYYTTDWWLAETMDTNMFISKDDFLSVHFHFEDAVGGDTAPTSGILQVYVILECEVL